MARSTKADRRRQRLRRLARCLLPSALLRLALGIIRLTFLALVGLPLLGLLVAMLLPITEAVFAIAWNLIKVVGLVVLASVVVAYLFRQR